MKSPCAGRCYADPVHPAGPAAVGIWRLRKADARKRRYYMLSDEMF